MPSNEPISVRVAPEILTRLHEEGSEPVHVIAVELRDDGAYDLVLRRPERFVYVDTLLTDEVIDAALAAKIAPETTPWAGEREQVERALRGAIAAALPKLETA